MLIRIISGVIGSLLICITLFFNKDLPILINILVALATLICASELLVAKGMLRQYKLSVPCMLFAATFPILISGPYWAPLVIVFTLVMFCMMIFYHKEINFTDLSFLYLTVMLSTVGMSTMIMLCDKDRMHTGYYITLALVIPWVADAGAYFVGSFFGKHKLCPNISPKKTVEGAIGGVVLGVVGALVQTWVFIALLFKDGEKVNFIALGLIALICTVVSIFGDLSFSLIKRGCHIKDYGSIIPGHGGILDRCDSVIFSAPVLLVLLVYFPVITF